MNIPHFDPEQFAAQVDASTSELMEVLTIAAQGHTALLNQIRALANDADGQDKAAFATRLHEQAEQLAHGRDMWLHLDIRAEKVVNVLVAASISLRLQAQQENPL